MADVEPEFDVEKDLPEFLSSVLDRTEQCIHYSETDISDVQAQSVVLDRTVSLLSSIALTDIEQDRIEWESLATAFAEVNYGRFAYGSFRLRSVRLRLESIRLRLICQFAYVLKHVLQQLIHLLYVRSRSDPSRSIQFLERDS